MIQVICDKCKQPIPENLVVYELKARGRSEQLPNGKLNDLGTAGVMWVYHFHYDCLRTWITES